jgi:hypothetical protein
MDSSMAARRACNPAKSKIPPEFVDSGAERGEVEDSEIEGHGDKKLGLKFHPCFVALDHDAGGSERKVQKGSFGK